MASSSAFQLYEMDKIIRSQGAERVSEDASQRLSQLLADQAEEILFKAKILARHAGRKDIKKEDVLLAAQKVI